MIHTELNSSDKIFIPNLEGLVEHYFKSKRKRDKFVFYYLAKNDQLLGEEVVINYEQDDAFYVKFVFSLVFYKASKLLILRIAEEYEQIPSQFDTSTFDRLKSMLKTLGSELKDYFVMSETDYYSFLMQGKKRKKGC